MSRRIPTQTIRKQNILKFFHQHGKHPIGIGNGKTEPFRTSKPHQPVGKPVRIEPGEYGHGGKGNGGDLQGKHQQRRDGRSIAAEKERHQKQITGLGKDAQGKQKQHQSCHMRHDRGGHHQQEADQEKRKIIDKPWNQAEKQIPCDQNPRVQRRNDSIVVSIRIFQNLIAEEIHGEFIEDILRQFVHPFFHT